MTGERRVIVEGNGRSETGIDAPEDCGHGGYRFCSGLSGQPGGDRDPRLSLMKNEDGPGPLADDEVVFPVSGRSAILDLLWAIMDRAPVLDGIA